MKNYYAERIVKLSPDRMWDALKCFNIWVEKLETIERIEWDNIGSFCTPGRKYKAHTPEKVIMECKIEEVNDTTCTVILKAKFRILQSKLYCGVISMDGNVTKIIRKQSYPGLIGFIFTTFFNKRESKETEDYLVEWEKYAKAMTEKTVLITTSP